MELIDKEDAQGKGTGIILRHHIKYKELHGEDKTVRLTASEHMNLHIKLRREGKCKVPSKKLCKISIGASKRVDKPPDWIRRQVKKDIEKKT